MNQEWRFTALSRRSLLHLAPLVFGLAALQGCQPPDSRSRAVRFGADPVGTGCAESTGASVGANSPAARNHAARIAARPTMDAGARLAQRVLIISVDGLGGTYLERALSQGKLPGFAALKLWGSSTTQARADFTHTVTLPNHTSLLTGRPVLPVDGFAPDVNHGYTDNGMPQTEQTLHTLNPKLGYVRSVFDVAHDHGLRTCLYAGKRKFILFARSYDSAHGAVDQSGSDNGRNKIDRCVIVEEKTADLVATAAADMNAGDCDLAFIHIADLDRIGHESGWGSEPWSSELERVDSWIGQLTSVAAPDRSSRWGVVLTADHGGIGKSHGDPTVYENYRIPFFVVAPGLAQASDLYTVAGGRRANPGPTRTDYREPVQPIRNLDAADAALSLLGLGPIVGSFAQGLLRERG